MSFPEEEEGLRPFAAVLIDVLEQTAYLYQYGGEPQGPPTRKQYNASRARDRELHEVISALSNEPIPLKEGPISFEPQLRHWKLRFNPYEEDWSDA